METLTAQKRDMKMKAKKLRRDGFVVGVVFGKDLDDSMPIQINAKEASQFIKKNKEGAQVALAVDADKIHAIVKNYDYDPMKKQINSIEFQSLVAGEKISTTAQIRLVNEEAVKDNIIEQELTEIHYKADPAHLVDVVEVDFAKFKDIKNIIVGDLDIAKNNDIVLVTPLDAMVVHVGEQMAVEEDEAEVETQAEA